MIGKLRGHFAGHSGEAILVDVGGVGYVVRTVPDFLPEEGASLELYIHTAVREDAIDLYGFPTRDALSFFKLLMSVSGIGPKTALGILSVADIPSLRNAIAAGDTNRLIRVFGIGKKSAERMVVELKDKLAKTGGAEFGVSADAEVVEALEALGYTLSESRKALQSISGDVSGVRERLAAALKNLGASVSV